jgi:hypothetical protein
MTLKEKMDKVLEDFDDKYSCPNSYSALNGHYIKNTELDACDGKCKACWNQEYIEENVIDTIEAMVKKIREAIDSYDHLIAIQDALDATLAKIKEEK